MWSNLVLVKIHLKIWKEEFWNTGSFNAQLYGTNTHMVPFEFENLRLFFAGLLDRVLILAVTDGTNSFDDSYV